MLTFTPPQPPKQGGWQWDTAQIEALDITDNVVDLIIDKLEKLPADTQQVLKVAACVGNRFDLATLALIHQKPVPQTFQDLLPALQQQLALPTSKLEVSDKDDPSAQLIFRHYKFRHDRVQQAAYGLMSDEIRNALHLKIGRVLLAHSRIEEREEKIFDIVGQLNEGLDLIHDHQEKSVWLS